MYFHPLVIPNLQMGANEAQRSAKRHDLEHRLSLRILPRIHREKGYIQYIGNGWTSAIRKEYWDPINLYNLYITQNEYNWTEISTTLRQFALFFEKIFAKCPIYQTPPSGGYKTMQHIDQNLILVN